MPEPATAPAAALPVDLVLPFLERRNYLHGTTLFDAMLPFAPVGADLSFKISHRLETDRIRLQSNPHIGTNANPASASLIWTLGETSATVAAFPLPASQNIARQPYPEMEVERHAKVTPQAAVLDAPSPFGFVATLIPLFKVLLRQEVRCTRHGQWMFTRLDLGALPAILFPLQLTLTGVVPNYLARARISCASRDLGVLYFSWVSQG